ncbi:Oleuropein beta-glucosidase [Sesamum alatum]|uniref:Oleuropein beta-glucosidase n=1 Tax=Sesamum alatum TaxID=300844 RepID=A0AAE1XZM4_9LAMI|nr:Oleuropein beta-glucosidase [Sesamum alatum]
MSAGPTQVPAHTILTDFSTITRNDFPSDFVFGTGTSAYQHEGGAAKGGRGLSVWDVFTLRTPGKVTDGSNGNVAADMYTKYKEDIKMMKSMGFDAYRFSISWPRILPDMEPYVTLFHWDLPYALEQEYGGFLSQDIVNDFRDFAELCFWEFGDRVKYWITLNEPWTYCNNGYVTCTFPPGAASLDPAQASAPAPGSNQNTTYSKTLLSSGLAEKLFTDNLIASRIAVDDQPRKFNFIPYRGSETLMDQSNLNLFLHRGAGAGAIRHDYDRITYAHSPLESRSFDKTLIEKFGRSSINGFLTLPTPDRDVYTVGKNLLLAHAAAVQSYRTKFKAHQNGQIGITLVSCWFEPLNKDDERDRKAAERARDFMLGWFLEPVLSGKYPQNMRENVSAGNLPQFEAHEVDLLKGSIDFLGLNYYTSFYASHDPDPNVTIGYHKDQKLAIYQEKMDGNRKVQIGEPAGSSWLCIVPRGIYELLKEINQTYNNSTYNLPPIYITENGVDEKDDHTITAYQACKDEKRIKYHQDHLGNILKAMNDKDGKVNVKGYFAWSFCDNFEWHVGYTSRFGIIYIDYKNHLRRHPKESATWFSKFLVKKAPGANESGNNQGSRNNVPGANESGNNQGSGNNVPGANESGNNQGSRNNVPGANESGNNQGSGNNVPGANESGNNQGSGNNVPGANESGNNQGSGNNAPGANESGNNQGSRNNVPGANESGNNQGSGNNVPGANESGNNQGSGNNVPGANESGNNQGPRNNVPGANESGNNKGPGNNVPSPNESGNNQGSGNNIPGANESGNNQSSGSNVPGANELGDNKGPGNKP